MNALEQILESLSQCPPQALEVVKAIVEEREELRKIAAKLEDRLAVVQQALLKEPQQSREGFYWCADLEDDPLPYDVYDHLKAAGSTPRFFVVGTSDDFATRDAAVLGLHKALLLWLEAEERK